MPVAPFPDKFRMGCAGVGGALVTACTGRMHYIEEAAEAADAYP